MRVLGRILFIFVVVSLAVGTQAALMYASEANFDVKFDVSQFCMDCSQRRNHKDTYADPSDCHSFVKCFYLNETYATGVKMGCPLNTFWHDEILACMPEGPTPCSDQCRDPVFANFQRCYGVPGNCASFYVCAVTSSYPFCCPPGTAFNASSCQCDTSETCTDSCVLPTPLPTTAIPPSNFGTYCIDSYKNRLEPTSDASTFRLIGEVTVFPLSCPSGTTFSMESCRCEGEVVPDTKVQSRQCFFYLPFDNDGDDHSNQHKYTDVIQPVSIDHNVYAEGTGSIRFNGGRVEIPAHMSIDVTNKVSICFFYRCAAPPCIGGLMSDSKDAAQSDFGVVISSQSYDSLLVQGAYSFGSVNLTYTVDNSKNNPSNFTQFCTTLSGTESRVYINNEVVSVAPANFQLKISHCPLVLGTDQRWGDYNGYMDEFLVCPFGMTAQEVNAHWTSQGAMKAAGLIP